eukprot:scaffold36676_cov240-Skeletonema_marinoi.AAC.5
MGAYEEPSPRPRRWEKCEKDNNDCLDISERALLNDIRDDESEESVKVLLRYCGCNQEGYGESYQNASSFDTTGTGSYETSGGVNDLIQNIETIAATAADDNVDNNENGTTVDNGDGLLPSPSGKLLMSADADVNDDEKGNKMMGIAEAEGVSVEASSNDGIVVVDEEKQLSNHELTPTHHQPDDKTPIDEQPYDEAPYDEFGNAPYDEQPDENAPIEPQAIQSKSGNIKCAQEVMIRCNDHRHPIHAVRVREVKVDIPPRMRHSAISPARRGRKIALSLHNAPEHPTTKHKEKDYHNNKEVNTEYTPTAVQGEKEGPVSTLKDSGELTNVEEMDMLIKSTHAWLETQKAERKVRLEMQMAEWKALENIQIQMTETKVMDNTTTAKAVSPRRKIRGRQQHNPREKAMVDAMRAIAFH